METRESEDKGVTAATAEPGARGVRTSWAHNTEYLFMIFNRQITYIAFTKSEALGFATNMLAWAQRMPDETMTAPTQQQAER